jgi:two-component system LytT family response regulator
MSLRVLVIDDEFLARENLKLLLNEFCEDVEILGDADNIEDAQLLIERTNPDAVFLDIRMPSGAEGFDLLDNLKEINFQIVFATAFKDFAIQAFKANAVDYILKPIEIDELQNVVAKLKEGASLPTQFVMDQLTSAKTAISKGRLDKIAIGHSKGITLVNLCDVLYFKADGNYTQIYLRSGEKLTDSRTLKVYYEMLNLTLFTKIHQSYIINTEHIKGYSSENGHFAIMENNDHLPVSRGNVPAFIDYIKQFRF